MSVLAEFVDVSPAGAVKPATNDWHLSSQSVESIFPTNPNRKTPPLTNPLQMPSVHSMDIVILPVETADAPLDSRDPLARKVISDLCDFYLTWEKLWHNLISSVSSLSKYLPHFPLKISSRLTEVATYTNVFPSAFLRTELKTDVPAVEWRFSIGLMLLIMLCTSPSLFSAH